MLIGLPQRFTTMTDCTLGVPSRALSTFALSSMTLPRRQPPSAVMTSLALQSLMRSLSDSGLNPPNTTVWMAPTRAQASIATTASGIIGR